MVTRKFIFILFLLTFITFPLYIHSENTRGLKVTEAWKPFGTYHALIIGINTYIEWPHLKTAANDAKALKTVLIDKYGFDQRNVILRVDDDASLETLMHDFRDLAFRLGRQDNLIIYYAGHGQLDDLAEGGGFWIPVDGKINDSSSWIPHTIIKNILSSDKIKAKNIALVSDSCYSGEILRLGPSAMSLSDKEYSKKILTASLRRSRQVFTSGGIEPVADVGKDGHSLFAYYLLKALNENEQDIIDLENLFFSRVWAPLIEYGVQRPFVGRMNTHMDENGQFILVSSQDRSASVLEALNRDRLDSQIRLAIFPWKLTGSAYKWNYLAIGGVQKSLSANETLIPLYSYYDLQTDPRPIYLDKYFLSEDVIKNLWSGSRPNFDLVYTLATQLKIDAVLMCSIYAKIFDPDPAQIDIFLIDRETRKVYKKTGNTVDYEDRGEEIISRLVEKVFRAYLESHIP